ncbi:MAG: ABC transporter permease [Acidobacteria bacterium]|jgi:ABC-2 type transport system permease protein|nr:MAG: ABC transporter permease [Acidobacteriota bacterium]
MNAQSTPITEPSFQWEGYAARISTAARPLYWSIRRELWENRYLYMAPLAAGAVFLSGVMVNMIAMRRRIAASSDYAAQVQGLLSSRYELLAGLMMATALILSIFYCLDALYGERRDRSILFWKSLPVSDVTAVISKLSIPVLVLPLLGFGITLATEYLMLLVSSAIFAGSGVSITGLWTQASVLRIPLIWLYHLVTVHGLWYAPLYAWLLLVSAWAPRAPFMWALLPPFVICGVEKLAFNTSYFLNLLQYRFMGSRSMQSHDHAQDFMASLLPHHFFSNPDLWTGLVVAAVFLFAAVRMRRSRGPI